MQPAPRTPTVAVLGVSYGGARVAHLLAQGLPQGWRIVLIDRNSHINHLYVLPRFAVLPGHEHKAFIPYHNIFSPPPTFDNPTPAPLSSSAHAQVFLNATVTALASHSLTLDRAFPEHGIADADRTLHFDFLVYALGSHLPAPINLWGPVADCKPDSDVLDVVRGTRLGGIAWLKQFQQRVARASSVLVVGGGALGVQFATDIAEIHPATKVTLLHSRHRLLPRFDYGMHTEIVSTLESLNVCTVLGDRLDMASLADKQTRAGERVVRTQSGRELSAELVLLCTGQTPNTALLREAFPNSVIADGPDKGLARVRRTMQLAEPVPASELEEDEEEETAGFAGLSLLDSPRLRACDSPPSPQSPQSPLSSDEEEEEAPAPVEEDPHTRVAADHIFVIGDAADAFGAVNAGHNAFFQGQVAAENIVRLAKLRGPRGETERRPQEGAQEALGTETELVKYAPGPPAIKVTLGLTKCVYQFQGVIGTKDAEQADLDVHLIWRYYGYPVGREELDVGYEARWEAERASAAVASPASEPVPEVA